MRGITCKQCSGAGCEACGFQGVTSYPSLQVTSDGEDFARIDASCFRPVLDLTSDELRSLRRAAARADNGRWWMNQCNPKRTTELFQGGESSPASLATKTLRG